MYGYGVFRYRAYCKNCCCNQRLKSKCANPVKIAFYTVLRWLKHPFFCCLVKKKESKCKEKKTKKEWRNGRSLKTDTKIRKFRSKSIMVKRIIGQLGYFTVIKCIVFCCTNVMIISELIHTTKMTVGNTHMLRSL